MTYTIESHNVATPIGAVSHRHARGLARDFLRNVRDQERKFAPFTRLLRTPLPACRTARERQKIVARLDSAMRRNLHANQYRSLPTSSTHSGLRLTSARLAWEDDSAEELIVVQRARVHTTAERLEISNTLLASVSHHAIARMFERLPTTDHTKVWAELMAGLQRLSDIFDACNEPGIGQRVLQLALPTATGALLGWRSRDSKSFQLRTWIATGGNARVDRTQAAVKAWLGTPTSEPGMTFRRLIDCPENQWMLNPHQA